MNIVQLSYLVEVAKQKSYAKAAKKFFVSPQAVQKSVRQLEQELGVQLFVREGRAVRATDFAERYAKRAQEVLREFDGLASYADACKGDLAYEGSIVIASARGYYRGSALLETWERDLKGQCPGVSVRLLELPNGSCLDALTAGLADVAVVMGPVDDERIACEKLATRRCYLAVSKASALSSKKELSIEDLSAYEVALPDNLGSTYATFSELAKRSHVALRWTYVPLSLESQLSFIAGGGGVITLSNASIFDYSRNISAVPLSLGDEPGLACYAVYPRRQSNALAVPVIEALRKGQRKAMRSLERNPSALKTNMRGGF